MTGEREKILILSSCPRLTWVKLELNMRLLRLGRATWEVLLICTEGDRCPVLDVLEKGHKEGSKQGRDVMLSLLRGSVPFTGPQLENSTVCKQLHPPSEGLYEFRKQPRGSKPRVLWFFGGERRIVCAVAFFKRDETPPSSIREARALKEAYFRAKAANQLTIIDLPQKGGGR
jgi:Phage derived protein Gp49-like (DUF891)